MYVVVGPDVPEDIAKKLGERYHVTRVSTIYPNHTADQVIKAASRDGIAAIVTNDTDLQQAAAKSWTPPPVKVMSWGGPEPMVNLSNQLDQLSRDIGQHEELLDRLSREKRQERGYHRPYKP